MTTQIWVGIESGLHIEQREIPSVSNRGHPWHKPQYKTGLWTSTWDPETGGDWVQWALGNEYDVPKDGAWNCYLLEPSADARVYEIDDYSDLHELVDRYPMIDLALPKRYPDWEAVGADYDGVHLTQEGEWKTRLSHPLDLYGWDCESTLWFRWVFDSAEYLGRRGFEPASV